jgi:hypothetical protein
MAGLGKQAKVLSERQIKAALAAVGDRRYPQRDRVMVLLSVRAGQARWAYCPPQQGAASSADRAAGPSPLCRSY